jgi:hypothetical protein
MSINSVSEPTIYAGRLWISVSNFKVESSGRSANATSVALSSTTSVDKGPAGEEEARLHPAGQLTTRRKSRWLILEY